MTVNLFREAEAFELVRNSKVVGKDSMSFIDECWTDEELSEDIRKHFEKNPESTPQEYLELLIAVDKVDKERDSWYA
jgi:hypothetical protein